MMMIFSVGHFHVILHILKFCILFLDMDINCLGVVKNRSPAIQFQEKYLLGVRFTPFESVVVSAAVKVVDFGSHINEDVREDNQQGDGSYRYSFTPI